jgi:DNA-binding transcriptional ArsR family regulator
MPPTKTARPGKIDLTRRPDPTDAGGRPPLTSSQAGELMALFKVLANDTRLRLLHALVCHGELTMSGLAAVLGMKPQAVSNQLQRLLDRRILASRRQGNNVYYRIVNPCVTDLLDRGLCLIADACGVSSLAEPRP